MITAASLAIFRDQDPDQPYMSGSGLIWRRGEEALLEGPSFPEPLEQALSLLTYQWAAALQMPGFVMGHSDPAGLSYRLVVDGSDCGRVELVAWFQSDLPNRAGVALLYGVGEAPPLIAGEVP